MKAWLYQMVTTDDPWDPEQYRLEVWEGQETKWPHRKVTTNKLGDVTPGDLILLFFAKSNTKDHGIYGWGVISKYTIKTVSFWPAPPSDFLKMFPCWDDEIDQMVDLVRGSVPMGTMWAIDLAQLNCFRAKIRDHASPMRA